MQLIKRELNTILHSPPLKPGDAQVFEGFVLAVASPQSCGAKLPPGYWSIASASLGLG